MLENFVYQFYELGLSTHQIAQRNSTIRTTICERTVRKAIKRYEATGIVDHPPRNRQSGRVIEGATQTELVAIVEENPWLFLSEIAAHLHLRTRSPTLFSVDAVYAALKAVGMSMKVMQRTAAQRDEIKRAA